MESLVSSQSSSPEIGKHPVSDSIGILKGENALGY